MSVSKEEIQAARKTDLYCYLRMYHPDKFVAEGRSLKLAANPSVSIKSGYSGYYDFSSGECGNSIDFLVRYFGFSFMDAVSTLVHSGKLNSVLPVANYSNIFALPESSSDFKAAESYLLHRGISQEILMLLVEKKLIYQDRRQNVVFVNEGRDFCEVRGTYPSKSFHQCRKASADGYWAFSLIDDPQSAFICEAAIDALSLLQLHLCNPSVPMTAAYCSIAGVMNQEAILRIAEKYPSVLAVDNDAAGNACRERNPSFKSIRPVLKDWNEDLLSMKGKLS